MTLLSIHLICSIRSVVCAGSLRGAIVRMREFLASLVRLYRSPDESTTPIDEEVSRLMRERQKKRMSTCCTIVCHLAGVCVAAMMYSIWSMSPRWMSFEQDMLVLASFATLLVVRRIGFEYQCTAVLCYSVLMVFAMLWVVVAVHLTPFDLVASERVFAFWFRFAASVSVLQFRVTVFWNAVCSIFICTHLIIIRAKGDSPIAFFVGIEIMQFLLVIIMAEGLRMSLYSELHHEVNAAAGSIEKSAVKALLDNVCEVILPLDSTFAMSEDVPRFKGMLMLNPNSSLNGVRLDTYIPFEEDKALMYDQLKSLDPSRTDSVVRGFNLTMRDSDGNDIDVEAFGVAFETLNKSIGYMLGIRELSELQGGLARRSQVHPALAQNPLELVHRRAQMTSTGGEPIAQRVGNATNQADASSSSDASVASTPPSDAFAVARQLSNLNETSDMAKVATSINLIGSWNFSASRRSCCSMHAGLVEVKRILKRVRRLPCMKNLHVPTVEQCSACGVLECYDNGISCRVCKHRRRISL
eukprot:TRINITY_DN21031_c0_g1_i2.p1 TRINITY_DN21031_c0_g1~~TRINITY_DN21031_c0_g1_i2.p1  ORF type:complete len:559 (-),score=39.16 TRINITY_DN21031_c0_g1_i2:105-1682(-)